jgi:hypothetical protein
MGVVPVHLDEAVELKRMLRTMNKMVAVKMKRMNKRKRNPTMEMVRFSLR